MARVLIVYHRAPGMMWRSTYASHLCAFERYSDHECYYVNSAWPRVPGYLKRLNPDLVILHYTCLAVRWDAAEYERQLAMLSFVGDLDCPKAIVPHDEHIYTDRLCRVVEQLGVTHAFTPAAEAQWHQIYADVADRLKFQTVLTGYLDEEAVERTAQRATNLQRRIDVGYRSWAVYPNFGRHGRLKSDVGRVFAERSPRYGLTTDISSDPRDALLGESWFEFLLDCKYTIGCEGGSSILDRDGSVHAAVQAYRADHPAASFEEIEAACFPGRDGELDYRLLGPRHLEAVMTGTCQVLVEGEYGGALKAGVHYVSLARDFSNIHEVLAAMKSDEGRAEMVARAYEDVVASGAWTYRALADAVLGDTVGLDSPIAEERTRSDGLRAMRGRVDAFIWGAAGRVRRWWRLVSLLPIRVARIVGRVMRGQSPRVRS